MAIHNLEKQSVVDVDDDDDDDDDGNDDVVNADDDDDDGGNEEDTEILVTMMKFRTCLTQRKLQCVFKHQICTV